MGKYFGKSRYDVQPLLMQRYNLSEKDWDRLTQLWHSYGMRTSKNDMSNRTPSKPLLFTMDIRTSRSRVEYME